MTEIKTNKFHGMTIVSDRDNVTVKGKNAIAKNSNGDIVCPHYDINGYEEDEQMVFDIVGLCISI